jgi:serine/threonine-protein kinase
MLGRGGMGMVFKAFDAELNRPVAVKLLAPHVAGNGSARQRFGREARAAAAVVHEHVIAIHDVQASGDTPYLVMQYVPGDSLQAHVDRHGPLDVRDVVRVGHQIAAGLAAAHAQGVVHRDIKPGNILLENGLGRIVITDFGLAQAADECSLTHTGTLAGTPHYMSPEQADARPLDHRTDLFSLGSVLYFMASGRVPFRGDRAMSVLRSICEDEPPPLRSINPEVPAALETLIARLHAKSPDQRFGSAADVRDLLADYLVHLQQPLTAPLPHALRGVFRMQQHRWWLAAAAGVLLAATAGVWKALDRIDGPSAPGNTSPSIGLPAGLLPLEDVDRQLREIGIAIGGLEQIRVDAGATPSGGVSMIDAELSGIEAEVQGLEAAGF